MTDWNHTTESNAQQVMKIHNHRDSHRCSLLSKRWHCKTATSPLRAVEKAGQLQGWQNKCGYTAVHAQIWSGASIEFRRNRAPRNRGWLGTKNPREAVKKFEE